jgi:hypothetical protein
MSIINLNVSDPRWVNFISNHPDATIFHHAAWSELVAECYGYHPFAMAIMNNRGEVTAGLPIIEANSRLTGQRAVALPFSDFCSPLGSDKATCDELIQGLQAWRRENKCPQIQIHWPLPEQDGVYAGEPVVRHITDLHSDSDELFRSFRKGVKSSIHQSEKAGVTVKQGDSWADLKLFYQLHLQTRQRLGTPVQPLRFFQLLWRKLLSQGLGFLLLGYKDSKLIAGAVFLHWNKTLTYKYSASDPTYLNLRPNNLVLWHAIQWGCEHSYRLFDWGKSEIENEGLRTFKHGWASEEQLMHYSVLADRPPTPSMVGKSRRFLSQIIRHSPPWVCRLIGELFYKYAA